jgi:hypothetical protein
MKPFNLLKYPNQPSHTGMYRNINLGNILTLVIILFTIAQLFLYLVVETRTFLFFKLN